MCIRILKVARRIPTQLATVVMSEERFTIGLRGLIMENFALFVVFAIYENTYK